MKKLNKDSGILKNSVEAYFCSSCSYCSCPCSCQPESYSSTIKSGQLLSPAIYASEYIRA